MAAQLSFLNQIDYNLPDEITGKKSNKLRLKRVHFKIPTYIKKYSFTSINPFTGEIQFLGDEKHIFRIRILQHLYSIIYGYCNINLFDNFEKKEIDGLTVWGEDKQAEITNSWDLPLGDRVRIHIKLLRYLRNGFSVQDAMQNII